MPRKHSKDSQFVKFIEQYPEVKKWYLDLKRGSITTADASIPNFRIACQRMQTDPRSLLKMSPKLIQDKLETLVSKMEKKLAPKYLALMVHNVKSFCANHDKKLDRKIKIKDSDEPTSLKNERVPTSSELDQIIAAGSKKSKVAVALMAYSGLRPEVLGYNDASDGLVLGDMPELVIGDKGPYFKEIPARVVVRKNLSKARRQYFSFMNQKACELILEYLKRRFTEGEKLSQTSPLILSQDKGTEGTLFVTTKAIGLMVKRAILRAGFTWRPYVLRAYFDTQLLIAENNGLISRDFRVFFMGHKGDMEARYTTAKRTLPDHLLKAMTDGYKRACEYLVAEKSTASQDEILAMMRQQYLEMAGYSSEEITKVGDLSKQTSAQIQDLVDLKSKERLGLHNGNSQQVVPFNEVKGYILKGWRFIEKLSDSEAIISLPNDKS